MASSLLRTESPAGHYQGPASRSYHPRGSTEDKHANTACVRAQGAGSASRGRGRPRRPGDICGSRGPREQDRQVLAGWGQNPDQRGLREENWKRMCAGSSFQAFRDNGKQRNGQGMWSHGWCAFKMGKSYHGRGNVQCRETAERARSPELLRTRAHAERPATTPPTGERRRSRAGGRAEADVCVAGAAERGSGGRSAARSRSLGGFHLVRKAEARSGAWGARGAGRHGGQASPGEGRPLAQQAHPHSHGRDAFTTAPPPAQQPAHRMPPPPPLSQRPSLAALAAGC